MLRSKGKVTSVGFRELPTRLRTRTPAATSHARSNHRLRAVHVGLVAAPGGASRSRGQPHGACLVVGRSERPTEVWVGLAVQGVEAGARAQVDWVALARVAKVGVAVIARRVQRPVQKPRHWVLVLRLARGTLGTRRTALDATRRHGSADRKSVV